MPRAAASISRYCPFFRYQQAATVLDYGTGTMRNALYLAENGFTVYAADLPEQVNALRGCPAVRRLAGLIEAPTLAQASLNVDLVLSTYVFNIIQDHAEQRRYLDNIVANLRPGGYLLLEVRCRRQGTECGATCSHHFKCPSCAKTYTHEELDALLVPRGFRRLSHYYRHQALAAVYQKETS
ncbi:MAG TPA: methyltransferase domain-containing protein [Geobacteraceae bacterium]